MNITEVTNEETEACRRMSDAIDLHLVAGQAQGDVMNVVDKWIVCRLSDGVSDGALYDSKDEAMTFAPKMLGVFDKQCLYIPIPLTGMPFKEALGFLRLMRKPYINTTAPTELIDPGFKAMRTGMPSNLSSAQRRQLIGQTIKDGQYAGN